MSGKFFATGITLLLLFAVFPDFSGAVAEDATNITQELATLKVQFKTLIGRRQEDIESLRDSFKDILNKDIQIDTLQDQIRILRDELDAFRKSKCWENCDESDDGADGNKKKNEKLKAQWLASTVTEMRGELSELAKSYNASVQLQQRETINTDMAMIRNDVVSLRHDFEMLKGELMQCSAKVATLSQDVEVSRQMSHSTAVVAGNLEQKLWTAVNDWTRTLRKLLKNKEKVYKRMVVLKENPLEMNEETSVAHPVEKIRRKTAAKLMKETAAKLVKEMQIALDKMENLDKQLNERVLKVERRITTELNWSEKTITREVGDRVKYLETRDVAVQAAIQKLTKEVGEKNHMHKSMLELLESVGSLETKLDNVTPDLRREISKLEFSLSQASSTTSVLKEHQDNQIISLKAMSESISNIQDKLIKHQEELKEMNEKVLEISNTTLGKTIVLEDGAANKADANAGNFETSQILQKLNYIRDEYESVLKNFPKDCSFAEKSGEYFILPDEGNPIFVYCDVQIENGEKIGYTVAQRRTTGEADFNKNWDEYAAGFGIPSGEFWLGNDALYRLTSANNTIARFEFSDLYGRQWYAQYNEFHVSDRLRGYRLYVDGYSGNASDALEYQNHMAFSTVDSDRDISNTNCAQNYEGGWWFSHCQHTNLNGRYNLGLTWFDKSRNEWIPVIKTLIKLARKF